MRLFETRRPIALAILGVCAAFAVTLFSVAANVQAQGQTLTLRDAVAKGLVEVEIHSTGDLFFQEALSYNITSRTPAPLTIVIPVGQIFEPEDSSLQPLLVAQAYTITLGAGLTPTPNASTEARLISYASADTVAAGKLTTFCIALSKHAPEQDQVYNVGQEASGQLQLVAEAINRKHAQGRLAGQLAVWRVTDDFTLDSLNVPQDQQNELLRLIAPLLGFARDEITLTQDILDDSNTGLKFYTGTLPDTVGPGGGNIPSVDSIQKQINDLISRALLVGGLATGGCLLGCLLIVGLILVLVLRGRSRPATKA